MNLLKCSTQKKTTYISVTIVAALFLFSSCAPKINFLTSEVVPAARGYVEIKKDKNKNNVISIHLTNLAEVNRLTPPRQTYVIWMMTEDEKMKNIGQVKSFSKNLKASFQTVSSSIPAKIIITAEDDASTVYPSKVILTTNRF